VRGSVLGRVDTEGQTGAWIEFPDAKLARKIDSGAASIAGRKQRRLGCDLVVEVKGPHDFLGRIVDLSMLGARILGPHGMPLGCTVSLRLLGIKEPFPEQLGQATISRSEHSGDIGVRFVRHDSGDIGVRFVRHDSTARIASQKLYTAVQQAWARTAEIQHSPLCCKGGTVLEPPLPHIKPLT
jgi:hypothetical protein